MTNEKKKPIEEREITTMISNTWNNPERNIMILG
jgi:hypothetical protein